MRTDPKPADAWWDPNDNEWVHGAKDADGRLTGEVRYWNADGILISTADHVDGKPHGIARRYYPNGELAQDSRYLDGKIHGRRTYLRPTDPAIQADGQLRRLPAVIATHVCVYDHGDLVGQLYFDAAGVEYDSNGRPMRPRPPGIPPDSYFSFAGWYWTRRRGEDGTGRLEAREWYESGARKLEVDYTTGTERGFYESGVLRHEGTIGTVGERNPKTGDWRYHDATGTLRRTSRFADGDEVHRTWHRPERGDSRDGAIDKDQEVGVWRVRDATGAVIAELDLGPGFRDAALLAHAVTAELLDDAWPPLDRAHAIDSSTSSLPAALDRSSMTAPAGAPSTSDARDRSLPAMLARARRVGIDRDPRWLDLAAGPAWLHLDDNGELLSLAKGQHYHDTSLVRLVHALRWGPPEVWVLVELAAALFRGDRAAAALDVIDAAIVVAEARGEPVGAAWHQARAVYLRALGRADEAERADVRPGKLDERALELLAEIRANPDDDAPRLVLADHLASRFPEHAELIVAQCSGRPDERPRAAFKATLPEWLQSYTVQRGFVDPRYASGEDFVTTDPDLVYRVAPTWVHLDLEDASQHVATLVTMPALRRFRELSFSDTYLDNLQIEQLASCPYFEALEYISFYNCGLDDADLATLARSTAFPKLTALGLTNGRDGQQYTLAGVRALTGAEFAPRLALLELQRRWLGDELIDVLAQFPALVSVDLWGNALTDAAAHRLIALGRDFTLLALGNNDFTDDGKRALLDRFGDRVQLGD